MGAMGAIRQGLGCDAETMPLLSGGLGALGVVTATFLVEAPGCWDGASQGVWSGETHPIKARWAAMVPNMCKSTF